MKINHSDLQILKLQISMEFITIIKNSTNWRISLNMTTVFYGRHGRVDGTPSKKPRCGSGSGQKQSE